MFRHACSMGLEGIVSKRRDAPPTPSLKQRGRAGQRKPAEPHSIGTRKTGSKSGQ
jgi:hypothetical protein